MKAQKILILASGNIYERQGQFNALLNRTKHLIELEQFDIDVLMLSTYETWLVRKLRKHKKIDKPEHAEVDGVSISIDWKNFSLLNYILTSKLHLSGISDKKRTKRILPLLKGYDFIVAHSYTAAMYAYKAKQMYNVPFSVTWHGSDIHTLPFSNQSLFDETKKIIEGANINLFVSKTLLVTSNRITSDGFKDVLYNGCDLRFYRYNDEQRQQLQNKYNIKGKKVVTFVGNFLDVKNILLIPEIFRAIYEKEKNIVFWMLGDGKFRPEVEKLINGLPVKLWGNQSPELVPDFLNCTNVQILPSKNEGLPLTMVEALRCGCHAVGSLAGGIPEVIGTENCIPLEDPSFVQKIADRVLYFLGVGANEGQIAASYFDWRVTAQKEANVIQNILLDNK